MPIITRPGEIIADTKKDRGTKAGSERKKSRETRFKQKNQEAKKKEGDSGAEEERKRESGRKSGRENFSYAYLHRNNELVHK